MKKRPFKGLRPLASTLDQAVRPAFAVRGFAEQRIITEWPSIVGPIFSQHSTPQKIHRHPQGDTLSVEVYDGSTALELSYSEPIILERIAVYFGYKAITRIKIIQHPVMPSPQPLPASTEKPRTLSNEKRTYLDTLLADITEDPLHKALYDLGTSLLQKKE